MDTIFMNSENSGTSEYHVKLLKLVDKLDLRSGQKSVAVSNLSIYCAWKNIKSSYKNNKLKISAPTWSDEFELPDESYSISDIQDYFEYTLKKHSESVDDPPIEIFVSRSENRITFKIKNGYYLELLTPETMKLLGSTENKITAEKNGENVPHLEVVECNPHSIKMRYSIEPTERRYVKGYEFLSCARNLNNKYGQNLADSAKKSATDAFKIASKTTIQKTSEATGDLIGNKIADKITSYSEKIPANETHSNDVSNEIPKERYICPQERQKIIDELRLI